MILLNNQFRLFASDGLNLRVDSSVNIHPVSGGDEDSLSSGNNATKSVSLRFDPTGFLS